VLGRSPLKICPVCGQRYREGDVCPRDNVHLRELPPDPMSGKILKGRYRLEDQIGVGGMGAIYRATNVSNGRTVAVKVLQQALVESDEHVARFRQEADLLSRIMHPNVVSLLDYGQEGDTIFMIMEHLTGHTLDAVVPPGGFDLDTALALMEEVCAGVGAAHQAGLIHRDLKPENIFFARQADGRSVVKVIDFGLARPVYAHEQPAGELTMRGRVVGSAGYVAPEHITGGRDFTPVSDVYALGAVLFHLLTGRVPYSGEDNVAIMTSQLKQGPPPLGLPPGTPGLMLEGVIHRAMNRNPSLRYQSTDDMIKGMRFVVHKAGQLGKSRTDNNTLAISDVTIQLQAPRNTPPPEAPPEEAKLAPAMVPAGPVVRARPAGGARAAPAPAAQRAAPNAAAAVAAAVTAKGRAVHPVVLGTVCMVLGAVLYAGAQEIYERVKDSGSEDRMDAGTGDDGGERKTRVPRRRRR
jgi:serine/threonine protein kinase